MPENHPEQTIVITDTSCFIILQKIEAIGILNELFSYVITTPEIAEEYGHPLPPWVIIQPVTNKTLQRSYNQHVDPGEASAMALATEIKCDYIIIDDYDARKFAEHLGFSIKGTVGILLLAKQAHIIPFIKPYLDLILKTNFRISPHLIKQVINDAGE